jgi:hypothetical protein
MKWALPLACLVVFHSPDGKELRIETQYILAVRTAHGVREQVAPGTRTILYLAGKTFGVVETPEEVVASMACKRSVKNEDRYF